VGGRVGRCEALLIQREPAFVILKTTTNNNENGKYIYMATEGRYINAPLLLQLGNHDLQPRYSSTIDTKKQKPSV